MRRWRVRVASTSVAGGVLPRTSRSSLSASCAKTEKSCGANCLNVSSDGITKPSAMSRIIAYGDPPVKTPMATKLSAVRSRRAAPDSIRASKMAFEGVDYLGFDTLLTEEQRLVRDTVRGWVDDRVLPIIEDAAWE